MFALATERKVVEDYKAAHGISDETIEKWLQDEAKYLQARSREPEYDSDAVRYVELLDDVASVKYVMHIFLRDVMLIFDTHLV